MGMYDRVCLEDGVALPDFDGDDPTDVEWQTKTFSQPAMEVYKLTEDGKLYHENADYEILPEEERPYYDEAIGGFEKDWQRSLGMMKKTRDGWERLQYHGILEFHAIIDEEYVSYETKFTDGDLEEIRRIK